MGGKESNQTKQTNSKALIEGGEMVDNSSAYPGSEFVAAKTLAKS